MNISKFFTILCSLFLVGGKLFSSQAVPENKKEGIEEHIQYTRQIVQSHSSNNPKVMKMFEEVLSIWQNEYIRCCTQDLEGSIYCRLLLEDFKILLKAVAFAAEKHSGQPRKDADSTPYIIHPIGVARSLWEEGNVRSLNVLISALLHDTLEDTDATPEEIESLFGQRVRETVEELTNNPSMSGEENKQRQVDHAPSLSLNAQLVKLADRLYNIRDLRNPPPTWNREKVTAYLNWGYKLLRALRGTNAYLENALEEEIRLQFAD